MPVRFSCGEMAETTVNSHNFHGLIYKSCLVILFESQSSYWLGIYDKILQPTGFSSLMSSITLSYDLHRSKHIILGKWKIALVFVCLCRHVCICHMYVCIPVHLCLYMAVFVFCLFIFPYRLSVVEVGIVLLVFNNNGYIIHGELYS